MKRVEINFGTTFESRPRLGVRSETPTAGAEPTSDVYFVAPKNVTDGPSRLPTSNRGDGDR
jgi:hypothetical protein